MTDPDKLAAVRFAFLTPRSLPKAETLAGRVVVLDIAFAAETGKTSFATVTLPFITALGSRLAAWVDHHDHERHVDYAGDSRFVLASKAQHGGCPEMVTPELVARVGPADSIAVHVDLDGLYAGAKWVLGGVEPYEGADSDARDIDTRRGNPGPIAVRIDRALRARPRDQALFGLVVRLLAGGVADRSLWEPIDAAGAELAAMEGEARRLSQGYQRVEPDLQIVDATRRKGPYDKTLLLLLGQERGRMSVVIDGDVVTFAAGFDSGVNFLHAFRISGGMPTRVSIQRSKLCEALTALGVSPEAAKRVSTTER
jgi:hypothetical protein